MRLLVLLVAILFSDATATGFARSVSDYICPSNDYKQVPPACSPTSPLRYGFYSFIHSAGGGTTSSSPSTSKFLRVHTGYTVLLSPMMVNPDAYSFFQSESTDVAFYLSSFHYYCVVVEEGDDIAGSPRVAVPAEIGLYQSAPIQAGPDNDGIFSQTYQKYVSLKVTLDCEKKVVRASNATSSVSSVVTFDAVTTDTAMSKVRTLTGLRSLDVHGPHIMAQPSSRKAPYLIGLKVCSETQNVYFPGLGAASPATSVYEFGRADTVSSPSSTCRDTTMDFLQEVLFTTRMDDPYALWFDLDLFSCDVSASGCSGHGTCVASPGSPGGKACECDVGSGWGGSNCNLTVCFGRLAYDPASCGFVDGGSGSSEGIPHGTCVGPNQCVCNGNWRGERCNEPRCGHWFRNDKQVCGGRGYCADVDTCICNHGWNGPSCSDMSCMGLEPDSPYVCHHPAGVCIGPDDCRCSYPFTGRDCQWLHTRNWGDGEGRAEEEPVEVLTVWDRFVVPHYWSWESSQYRCVAPSGVSRLWLLLYRDLGDGVLVLKRWHPVQMTCDGNLDHLYLAGKLKGPNGTDIPELDILPPATYYFATLVRGHPTTFIASKTAEQVYRYFIRQPLVPAEYALGYPPLELQMPNSNFPQLAIPQLMPTSRWKIDASVIGSVLVACNGLTKEGHGSGLDPSVGGQVCSGHGKCIYTDTCDCQGEHYGQFCSVSVCNGTMGMSLEVCSGHGACIGKDDCQCVSGWSGEWCETDESAGQPWPALVGEICAAVMGVNCFCCVLGIIIGSCWILVCKKKKAQRPSRPKVRRVRRRRSRGRGLVKAEAMLDEMMDEEPDAVYALAQPELEDAKEQVLRSSLLTRK